MLDEQRNEGFGSRPALEVKHSFFLGEVPKHSVLVSPFSELGGLSVELVVWRLGGGGLNERVGVLRDNKSSMFILKVRS